MPYCFADSNELASDTGFTLIKHKRAESGTFARSAAEMELAGMIEDGGVSAMHWIDPTYDEGIRNFTISGVDLSDQISAAISSCSSSARLTSLPDGLFPVSSSVVLANETIRLIGTGFTVLKYNGASGTATPIILADRGDATSTPGQLIVEGLVLDGNNLAGAGVYSRGCNRSIWRKIRTRNVTTCGFHILGDVSSLWENCTSSLNYADQSVNPATGMRIEGTTAVASSTGLTFVNLVLEGATANGLDMVAADACVFIGGACEGNGGWGVFVGGTLNRFYGLFCEGNASGDIDVHGTRNVVDGTFNSLAASAPYISVPSVKVRSGADQNKIMGRLFSATVDSGANDTDLSGAYFRANAEVGEADITDNGTRTVKYLTGSATWDPGSVASGAQTTTTVTVTGAAVGNKVELSFSNSLSGLMLTGYVSAANTVAAVLGNLTGGSVDLASGTLSAVVR